MLMAESIDKNKIPESILKIAKQLSDAGFEAYLVGGCTRDLLLDREPKDWDLTTNATPEQILKIFNDDTKEGEEAAFYENDYGTVTIKNEPKPNGEMSGSTAKSHSHLAVQPLSVQEESLRNVEITPYRVEGTYSDNRRPDEVKFSDKLEDDLKRRDFTINAIAYSPADDILVDLYDGIKDIKDKTIRSVENPDERFKEDALRMLRAIRLSSELGFAISRETSEAIARDSDLLKNISAERIESEFTRIVMSPEPMVGINMAQKMALLSHIIPELEEGIGCEQNGDHIYDVWEHSLRALQNAANKGWSLDVRLGALFHDVGKPRTREWSKEKDDWTFYAHDIVGAKMTKKIMERLKYPKKLTELVTKYVRLHLFFSDTDQITLSAVRRIITKMGKEHVWDLMNVRVCDRIGMGRPKERPYRLRKYESMIEQALRDPISVGMLKLNGDRLMAIMNDPSTGSGQGKPGPKIGWTLHALLEEVLDDPALNTSEYLEKRALELMQLPEDELKKLGEAGKAKSTEEEEKELAKLRKKHHVN